MKQNVLVIDDSMTVRADLQDALTAAGFPVFSCETKAAGRDLLKRLSFAIIILDVNLPDGDGIALLEELRRSRTLGRIPVILLSTEGEAETRMRGMARGAHEYVDKPYDRAYLVRRVRQLSRNTLRPTTARVLRSSSDQEVLLIDGGTAHRDALLEHLRTEQNEVVVARSGEEALEFLALHTFGSIILDAQATDGEGFDLCRRIKATPRGARAHLIVLTANTTPYQQAAWEDAGADEIVQRTPTFALLSIRLRTLWHEKRRAARLDSSRRSTGS